jgi:hypothetical protein
MLKRFWHKRISLFGRSVSLALVSSLILVTTVFAAWIILRTVGFGVVSIDTAAGWNSLHFVEDVLVLNGTCTAVLEADGTTITVDWAGVDTNSVDCQVQVHISSPNDSGGDDGYGDVIQIISDPGFIFTADSSLGGPYCGTLIAGDNGSTNAWVTYSLDPALSDPGTAYALSFEAQVSQSPPSCP